MPVNPSLVDLPRDVLLSLLPHLSLSDLSALARVSRSVRSAFTAEQVFRCLYLHTHPPPPTFLQASSSFTDLYRRSRALYWQPTRCEHTLGRRRGLRIVAVAADYVVCYTQAESKLIGFPSGWEKDVREVCEEVGEAVLDCCVQMHGGKLGVVKRKAGLKREVEKDGERYFTSFSVVDMRTGEVHQAADLPTGTMGLSAEPVRHSVNRPGVALLAGFGGEYLVCFADNGRRLHVVDWRTGVIARSEECEENVFSRLVRTHCPDTGAFLVTGIVAEERRTEMGERMNSVCSLVDESVILFRLASSDKSVLVDVVQSADGCIVASRRLAVGLMLAVWQQHHKSAVLRSVYHPSSHADLFLDALCTVSSVRSSQMRPSEEFRLGTRARQVLILPRGVRVAPGVELDSRVFVAGSAKDGSMIMVKISGDSSRSRRMLWTWAEMSTDGHMLVMCAQSTGVIGGFDTFAGMRVWTVTCGEELQDVALVGEHYLMATAAHSDSVYLWHFGAFCAKGGRGGEFDTGSCPVLLPSASRSNRR